MSQIPDKWDFAIHRYDIKTNEVCLQNNLQSIDEFKATGKLPKAEDFVEDEWTTDKIAIDMSGMMDETLSTQSLTVMLFFQLAGR